MTHNALLVGAADTVCAALAAEINWRLPRLTLEGAIIIGKGEAPLTIARHNSVIDINFAAIEARALVLTELPSVGETRAILTNAANANKRLYVLEGGKVRPLALDDIVGAPLGEVDWARIRQRIEGRRVLVTGAGGSIGRELSRCIAGLNPGRLSLLDSSEFNLFKLSQELRAQFVLADVRDPRSMRRWIEREKPEIVFHAAALKQVPLVEAFPCEGVLTNVVGTRNVVDAAHAIGADVIYVSTDKAVEPSGAMGASKRLGEIYCQSLDRRGRHRAIPVRLGNVLGSTGSVAPTFERQFASGGPLTVTDPNVTRFFISIPQAAQVLLQAAAIGLDPETPWGAALVVDMGDALPVVELARDIIRLNGLRPDVDVAITYVGMRPGEKLHEQLIGDDERTAPCGVEGVVAAMSAERSVGDLHDIIDRLSLAAQQGLDEEVTRLLFSSLSNEDLVLDQVTPIAANA